MIAQQYNLDVIANNLANVNTMGFKQQRAEFQDLMYQTFRTAGMAQGNNPASPVILQIGLGAQFSATAANFSPGPPQATGNPFDLAVNGPGFFRVLRPDGTFAYTRDGAFKPDATGRLVTSDGFPLDPPITIPPGATAPSISPQGVVSVILQGSPDSTPLDPPITLTVFPNPAALTRLGQNIYQANAACGQPVEGAPGVNGTGDLRSGFLEGSNVQVVEEMVRMILAQRAYEINSKAVQTSDDMLSIISNLKR